MEKTEEKLDEITLKDYLALLRFFYSNITKRIYKELDIAPSTYSNKTKDGKFTPAEIKMIKDIVIEEQNSINEKFNLLLLC